MSDPPAADRPPIDEDRRRLSAWLWRLPVLLATGGAVYGVQLAYRVHFAKVAPADPPTFADVEPIAVALLARFETPWASEPFAVADLPCLAVRVPEPVPGGTTVGAGEAAVHLVGYSRVCTHKHCIVDLSTDLELVAFAFNYRTDRPKLTCGCHYSVFDPLAAGLAVSGPAVRPLPRIRLRVVEDDGAPVIVADGVEAVG